MVGTPRLARAPGAVVAPVPPPEIASWAKLAVGAIESNMAAARRSSDVPQEEMMLLKSKSFMLVPFHRVMSETIGLTGPAHLIHGPITYTDAQNCCGTPATTVPDAHAATADIAER
jgi:hypothetical protein